MTLPHQDELAEFQDAIFGRDRDELAAGLGKGFDVRSRITGAGLAKHRDDLDQAIGRGERRQPPKMHFFRQRGAQGMVAEDHSWLPIAVAGQTWPG